MDSHIQPFVETIDQLHDDIYRAVEPLTDEDINWRHAHLSNTIGILLRHVAGSERYWIVEVVGGRPIHRHRPAEFDHERLEKAPLVANLRGAQAEVIAALADLRGTQLMDEVKVTFRGASRTFTKTWAVLHAVQHTAYHLGQIQLFRKMATEGKG